MIQDPRQLGALVGELSSATWSLAAIGALFESGLGEALREPRTLEELAARVDALPPERIARLVDAARARGIVVASGDRLVLAPGALGYSRDPMRRDLLGEIRSVLMQTGAYLDAASRGTPTRGWHYSDPRVLQAQGDSSTGFAGALAGPLGAMLDGLQERLAGGDGRFLDVGVGVAALSIAMCERFPALRVVGLDVFDVPMGLARDNVARAGLEGRVELRQLAIQDLREEEAFDLVWLPAIFLAPSTIPAAMARARAALRPGGWLLMPTLNSQAPDMERTAVAVQLEHWGAVTESEAMLKLMADTGFAAPRGIPGPGWVILAAAQR
jgi:precorrin-6B methylase 2